MNEKEAFDKIRARKFIKNNGRVLRTINLLRYRYEKLEDVQAALDDLEEQEYIDSLNYLFEEGYILLRDIRSKTESALADNDIDNLEAKVSSKGIRLLAGKLCDELVEV